MTLSFNEGSIRLLSDLEELGDTELFLVNQNNTEIFCFVLHLLPCSVPLFVRPMMTIQEMITKMIFPDFNRSIIVSRWTSMTKNMDQFLRHWIIGERMFSWFNIGPSSFPNRYSSCGRTGRISFLWFCFLIGLQNHPRSTKTHILRTAHQSEVSCSLSSWSLLLKFVTNLIKP